MSRTTGLGFIMPRGSWKKCWDAIILFGRVKIFLFQYESLAVSQMRIYVLGSTQFKVTDIIVLSYFNKSQSIRKMQP